MFSCVISQFLKQMPREWLTALLWVLWNLLMMFYYYDHYFFVAQHSNLYGMAFLIIAMIFLFNLLQGLDDMESDLFGGSLSRKAAPSKTSSPKKALSDSKSTAKPGRKSSEDSSKLAKSSKERNISPEPTKATSEMTAFIEHDTKSTKPKAAPKPRKKFDFGGLYTVA